MCVKYGYVGKYWVRKVVLFWDCCCVMMVCDGENNATGGLRHAQTKCKGLDG